MEFIINNTEMNSLFIAFLIKYDLYDNNNFNWKWKKLIKFLMNLKINAQMIYN